MTELSMKKLNKRWRRVTKKSTNGVKFMEKVFLVIRESGSDMPKTRDEQIKLAAEILSKPHTYRAEGTKAAKGKKKAAEFYQSWDWKKVRYEALRLHGHRCQCCGWKPGDTERGFLVVDHIKPRGKYPALALVLSNLQVLCNDCNMGKSNVFEDDFRDAHHARIQ